jgi:hypothetical protein
MRRGIIKKSLYDCSRITFGGNVDEDVAFGGFWISFLSLLIATARREDEAEQ